MIANKCIAIHMLDYEGKLDVFLDRAGDWIRVQEECIWTMMH